MPIRSHLDLSTGHITEKDSRLLADYAKAEPEDRPMRVLDYEYGSVVITSNVDPENPGTLARKCAAYGFSDAFCAIIYRAEKEGHMMVVFDEAGDYEDDLPTFEW